MSEAPKGNDRSPMCAICGKPAVVQVSTAGAKKGVLTDKIRYAIENCDRLSLPELQRLTADPASVITLSYCEEHSPVP